MSKRTNQDPAKMGLGAAAEMIVSASYKTDIPAFYGTWFTNRLNAGYCRMVNPYSGRSYEVSLRREDVDGFVFWTKNAGPFLQVLDTVAGAGFPFVVQYSINRYPRALEQSVVSADKSVEHVREIARRFGPKVCVWRYDPVIFCDELDAESHVEAFASLAEALAGTTDEVVTSFAQIYRKTRRNMDAASRTHGFRWSDPPDAEKLELAQEFVRIAERCGMRVSICSQRHLVAPGAYGAACVSAARLSEIAGRPIHAAVRGNRPDCGCSASRDIGEYDTCPHGCAYCYAVRNRGLARSRYRQHDPEGEYLFQPARD